MSLTCGTFHEFPEVGDALLSVHDAVEVKLVEGTGVHAGVGHITHPTALGHFNLNIEGFRHFELRALGRKRVIFKTKVDSDFPLKGGWRFLLEWVVFLIKSHCYFFFFFKNYEYYLLQ